jgi:5-amino-6-(5-phosphoribosylamino)uracil reductase
MAVSLDGRIASYPGETDVDRRAAGFTDAADREHLRSQLEAADAVIVGRSSLMASGGAWAIRNRRGAYPIWVVLTNRGLPDDARFFRQSELPRWLVSKAPLALPPVASGVRTLVVGDRPLAATIAQELRQAGARKTLLFGGADVNRQFYAEGLVDELVVTVCPLIIAGSAAVPLVSPPLPSAVRLSLVASQPQGNLVFLTYKVQKA